MILDKIFGVEERTVKVVTGAGVGQDATLNRVFGASAITTAGVAVTEEIAQSFSAVYRAVTLLSSTIASLPLFLYRRTNDEGDKEAARDHPLFRVLHRRPNPEMNAFFYRQAALAYVLLYGRHYSYIERMGNGQAIALWPMRTPDVRRIRENGSLQYDVSRVRDNDLFPKPPISTRMIGAVDILELTTFDGESIISHAREQLGEAIAAQQFGAGFYAGGAQPYMVIVSPTRIQDPEKFRERWEKVHGGSKRRIAVLENMDIKTVGMPLDDAQFLESRKFYVTEIARWFGVPPHKLGDLERSTFSNIEEQQLEWYEGLLPWLEMIEQETERQLLFEHESDTHFMEHNADGLLRGNLEKRYAAYASGIQWGFLNRNQVRRRENLNSMGPNGDVYLVPGNMTTADQAGKLLEPKTPAAPPPTPPANGQAGREAMMQAATRMAYKEAAEIRAAGKHSEKFIDWLDEYEKKWPEKWELGLRPAVTVCGHIGLPTTEYRTHCEIVRKALLDLAGNVTPTGLQAAIERELVEWTTLPERITTSILGE